MGIQWNWIKQRPHYIAEGLAERYNLVTLSKKEINRRNDENKTHVNVVYPLRMPLERNPIIKKINDFIYKRYLAYYLKRSKYLWICAPNEFSEYALLKCTKNHIVIYDCMDDMLAFPSKKGLKVIERREAELIKRADIVFCSASHLAEKLRRRHHTDREFVLLNNALSINDNEYVSKEEAWIIAPDYFNSENFKLCYIGTIADWFDFDLIEKAIREIYSLEVHLWGPYTPKIKENHNHGRLVFHGPVDHKYVLPIMEASDALIMPFVLNELILSVNPVKLYEYIYSGKPNLAPKYGESLPFGNHTYLYENKEDCISELKKIANGNPTIIRSKSSCEAYVKDNTWEKRLNVVFEKLENYNNDTI